MRSGKRNLQRIEARAGVVTVQLSSKVNRYGHGVRGRRKAPTMELIDLCVSLHLQDTQRTREPHVRVDHSVNLGILAADERGPIVKQGFAGAQSGAQRLGRPTPGPPLALQFQRPRRRKRKVGANGAAGELVPQQTLAGVEPESGAKLGNGKRLLVVTNLEVDARAVCVHVEIVRRSTDGKSRSGGCVSARSQEGVDVPIAACVADRVEGGMIEVQRRALQARVPQASPAEVTIHALDPREGLGAECRVLTDDRVLNAEARMRQ